MLRRRQRITKPCIITTVHQNICLRKITQNIQRAASGTGEVSHNIAHMTETSQEAGHASNLVMSASSELSKQSETMKELVDTFIEKLRTG